jgi:endonuclease YncB( thermonuclease family)
VSIKTAFGALSLIIVGLLSACTFGFDPNATVSPDLSTPAQGGETGTVVHIVDGDTFDVNLNGQTKRVRYIGINTPESNEPCFAEATAADSLLINGKTVRLVKDVSETDIYGRLLRYVYVGDMFVNAALVQQGYAEAVSYPPDTAHYDEFVQLEKEAAAANRGCHPTGIFNDGSYTR